MEKLKTTDDLPEPVAVIFRNRAKLAERIGKANALYTPPAAEHYLHLYPWDSSAAAIVLSHFGHVREAETEVFSVFRMQRPNGMVPNQQRVRGYRSYDPELLTFTRPWESRDYSQPPIWVTAIADTYNSAKRQDPRRAKLFLDSIYPYLKPSLTYYADHRQLSATNPLLFNVKAEETGRDSDESLNGYVRKI